jgi:hypothetical protein
MMRVLLGILFLINLSYIYFKINKALEMNKIKHKYRISIESIISFSIISFLIMLYLAKQIFNFETNIVMFIFNFISFIAFMSANMLFAKRELERRDFLEERKRRLKGDKFENNK